MTPKNTMAPVPRPRPILKTNKIGLLIRELSTTEKEELSEILGITPRSLHRFSANPLRISAERNYTIVQFLSQLHNREFDMRELIKPILV